MKRKLLVPLFLLLVIGLVLDTTLNQNVAAIVPGINTLVSVNNTGDGQGGNDDSPFTTSSWEYMQVSGNGRYVVFNSKASNLVANDTNAVSDIFVRDLINNTTVRVSVSSSGVQSNGRVNNYGGIQQVISSTGRYIVYASEASNLVDGQTIASPQIYMRDTTLNTTTIVTKTSTGIIGNGTIINIGGVSNDGRFILWSGTKNTNLYSTIDTPIGGGHVFVTDLKDRSVMQLNQSSLLSDGITPSMMGGYDKTMSCDGSFVAFSTPAKIDLNDTDTADDIYLFDLRNGVTSQNVTAASNSTRSSVLPRLSCNGEFLTFRTNDTVFSSLVAPTSTVDHSYLYDRILGTVSIVDTNSSGVLGTGSSVSNTVDDKGNVAFVSTDQYISGAYIQYHQIYIKHKSTGLVELLTKKSNGSAPTHYGGVNPSISADGKIVSYLASPSTTLINSDTNGKKDILVSQTGL